MASISSLTSSSSGSVYSNPNAIAGLASGMDTEAMIEQAVSGIKTKLENLAKDRTKLEWEQEAYRSIIDKLSSFADKYLSFTSSTNLLSAAFFSGATTVTPAGTYKNMISAVGSSGSDIKIKSATMATRAVCYGSKITTGENQKASGATKLSEVLPEGFDYANGGTFKINGEEISVTADDTMSDIAGKISKATGLEASFSETTGAFYIKSKTTGESAKIEFEGGSEQLMGTLFGAAKEVTDADGNVTQSRNAYGTNAEVTMEVNGIEVTESYESNQINVDGMTITLHGDIPAAEGEAVTFTTATDTDKIIKTVKAMIEEYNAIANEIKDAYATKPLTNSKGKRYEPLSEDDASDMSETAINRYEEKAKTGLLFADSDLAGLYDEMRAAINTLGFEEIGITTVYENGKTTLSLDEDKMRSTLQANPDKVKEAFTRNTGCMSQLQDTINKYAKTTGDKGILVKLAGSVKSPTSINDNEYKTKLDNLDEVIKRWEQKLSSKIDYYTKQYTRLEQMIANMNSQSSALSGLMGY